MTHQVVDSLCFRSKPTKHYEKPNTDKVVLCFVGSLIVYVYIMHYNKSRRRVLCQRHKSQTVEFYVRYIRELMSGRANKKKDRTKSLGRQPGLI